MQLENSASSEHALVAAGVPNNIRVGKCSNFQCTWVCVILSCSDNVAVAHDSLEDLCALAWDSFNTFGSFGALQRIRVHTEPVSSNSPEGHLRGENHVANRVRALRGLLPFKTKLFRLHCTSRRQQDWTRQERTRASYHTH